MPEGVDFTLPAGREVGVIGFSFCIIISLMSIRLMREGFCTASTAAALALSTSLLTAQTRITPPANKYTPAQDVQLGRQAAVEAEKQLPVMRDDEVTSDLEDIGGGAAP